MMYTTGIDIGAGCVKCVAVASEAGENARVLSTKLERIRRRDPTTVASELHHAMLEECGLALERIDYVATTGDAEGIEFRTGHFYGMTTHARGALFLDPEVRGVIDIGALHTRAILMDERSRVLGYRMTSQCASGSGQFLENIVRYLGVTISEVGELSLSATDPEKPSSICAVLSETDVINMVSRGIPVPDILKGIHLSMANRTARLLRSAGISGPTMITGGLSLDTGMVAAFREEVERQKIDADLRTSKDAILAGALGAALLGAYRLELLRARGEAQPA
jgi:benzoyl-CoA reductase subunit D